MLTVLQIGCVHLSPKTSSYLSSIESFPIKMGITEFAGERPYSAQSYSQFKENLIALPEISGVVENVDMYEAIKNAGYETMNYRDAKSMSIIRNALGVEYILFGDVEQIRMPFVGDCFVSVDIVDTATGKQVWTTKARVDRWFVMSSAKENLTKIATAAALKDLKKDLRAR